MSVNTKARPDLPQIVPDSPWIRRIPLRSPTLPPAFHTNAYVIGEQDLLIVDPGAQSPDALAPLFEALHTLRAEGRTPSAVLLTHQHRDHVSGAEAVSRAFDLPLWAHAQTAERLAETVSEAATNAPPFSQPKPIQRLLSDGESLPFGPEGLCVLHTPGHAPGHLCLFDKSGQNLVAGDMVASIGTIVVSPSDGGDMTHYLDSLRRLRALGPRRIWPAHGVAIDQSVELLDEYLAHRLMREKKVLAALGSGPQTLEALVPIVYDDTPVFFHFLARESLWAHLLALLAQGRVEQRQAMTGEPLFMLRLQNAD